MSDEQRLRRDQPGRTGPIRNWSTLYRSTTTPDANGTAPHQDSSHQTESASPWSSIVTHGVRLGYNVVEAHIRQGQRVAQQMNERTYTSEKIGNDIQALLGRIVRYYTDLGSLWGELADSLVTNPEFIGNLLRRGQSPSGPQANGMARDGTSPPIIRSPAIEVISTHPTQVTLDLQPDSEKLQLASYGLHAGDQQKSPLTSITFQPASEGNRLLLQIRVPEGQPPDVYTGVVVDRDTNLPRGTLTVRIVAQAV